jgi:hypothetical protein
MVFAATDLCGNARESGLPEKGGTAFLVFASMKPVLQRRFPWEHIFDNHDNY